VVIYFTQVACLNRIAAEALASGMRFMRIRPMPGPSASKRNLE
jgi:hypothetical protein